MKAPFYKHPYRDRDCFDRIRYGRTALTFAQPFKKNGEPRVYTSILLFLKAEGAATKKEILINGLGRNERLYKSRVYEAWFGYRSVPFCEETNGYLSKMFSDMKHAGLIQYWPRLKVWTLGDRYEEWKTWLAS